MCNSNLQKLSEYEETNNSLWKAAKNIKMPIVSTSPIRSNNGPWYREKKQKSDLFAEQLAEVFTSNQRKYKSHYE